MERLQKVMAQAGIASRRKSEEYILEGRVKVNGVVVTELGTKVSEEDYILVDEKPIRQERKVYILMNKPRNCVTTVSDDRNRPTVMDHLKNISTRVYPVGRLDFDTTGVLLLTNDGKLTNLLTHPSSEINKTYIATCKGIACDEDLEPLRLGVTVEGVKYSPAKVEIAKINEEKETSIIKITIHEGKNREVKKMMEYVGYDVLKLNRESFANLNTKGLYQGQYRRLTKEEINDLYDLVNKK
jgi:23S rRNA pseudouridine2605 synthase